MREIDVSEVSRLILDMCIEANYKLSPDMEEALQMRETTVG